MTAMADESRLEGRLDRALARTKSVRGAAIVIAAASTSITIAAGCLMTVADRDNFPSIGSGLWWAVQTVTTVGYGDHVPATDAGRIVAALVMLAGIGFLTVITAAITSSFVSRSRIERDRSAPSDRAADELQQINGRLERIEAVLSGRR
jgi:voltage-gated potassium channel